MMRWLRHWWRELGLACVAILSVVLAVVLVLSSLRLNLFEMEIGMRALEQKDADRHNDFLVERFVRQYRVYQHLQSQAESDRAELQVQMAARFAVDSAENISVNYWVDKVNVRAQNVLRGLLGTPPFALPPDSLTTVLLERAYALEQKQMYSQALEIYGAVRRDPSTEGVVWLHEGFSLAVMGEFDAARDTLRLAIGKYRNQPMGLTAAALLGYLESFVSEQERVRASDMPALEKATRLSMLFGCRQSIPELEKLALQSPESADRLYYQKGRCQEEQGQKKEAVRSYIQVLEKSVHAGLLVDANRRIYMAGTQLADSGQGVRHLALELNKILKDSVIQEMQELEGRYRAASSEVVVRRDSVAKPDEWSPEVPRLQKRLQKQMGPTPRVPKMAVPVAEPQVEPEAVPVVAEPSPTEPMPATPPPPVYSKGSKVRILMNDGTRHSGTLLTSSDADLVQIQTPRWVMGLSQWQIRSVEAE